MVKEPSHVKQLTPNHVCKIGLKWKERQMCSIHIYEFGLLPTVGLHTCTVYKRFSKNVLEFPKNLQLHVMVPES
jgi:hypothetical protein